MSGIVADIQGCVGSAVSAVAFGFSTSFWMMVAARGLNGLFNGNIAILKAAMWVLGSKSPPFSPFFPEQRMRI